MLGISEMQTLVKKFNKYEKKKSKSLHIIESRCKLTILRLTIAKEIFNFKIRIFKIYKIAIMKN